MGKYIPDWSDYIEQDYTYDPNKVQLVIDGDTLEPILEGDNRSFFVMQDGVYLLRSGNKLVRMPYNIQSIRIRFNKFIQALPEA